MVVKMLSRPLVPGGIVWPGDPTLSVEHIISTDRGDVCNVYYMHLVNHFGTHVDGPRHFNPEGPPLAQLPAERFVFHSVALIDLPASAGELITADELVAALPAGVLPELLMLRTGFGEVRATEPERYASHGPTLAPAAARLIVEEMPSVGAIAIDSLSVGSPDSPEENVAAHRLLCGCGRADGRYVLIYEDVRMDHLDGSPLRVLGLPLTVLDLDSAPVAMAAET